MKLGPGGDYHGQLFLYFSWSKVCIELKFHVAMMFGG